MPTPWIRIQSALLAAVLITALAVNLLLRRPVRRVYQEYAVLALNLALWFLTDALYALLGFENAVFDTARLLVATAIPVTTARFFQVLMEDHTPGALRLKRTLLGLGILTGIGIVVVPRFAGIPIWLQVGGLFLYIFGGVTASLLRIRNKLRDTESLTERGRLTSLLVAGGIAGSMVFLDYLPGIGYFFFGNIFVMLFLYFLFQIVTKLRLLDLYEFLGRAVVTVTFALVIATIFLFLTGFWRHRGDLFVFNTVIAALVIDILFEPLSSTVNTWISRFLFGERFAFAANLEQLQVELTKTVDAPAIVQRIVAALDDSRRVTHASVYLLSTDGRRYELAAYSGSMPLRSVGRAQQRTIFEMLEQEKIVTLDLTNHNLKALRFVETLEAEATRERLTQVKRILDELYAGVVIPFFSDEQVVGFMALNDDRLREPYSSDEIQLLHKVATQAAISLENSLVFDKLRERDRLAALGEMSAGLAHEIRNPLGAIKGAAELLAESEGEDASQIELATVIAEEVDRLNVVVSQFLHFAKPYRGRLEEVDLNALVKKTVQFLEPDIPETIYIDAEYDSGLPRVWTDPEMVRTIFINLALNACEAMGAKGTLMVRTMSGHKTRLGRRGLTDMVVVQFQDTGPGIDATDLEHIFIPFYTTKSSGTGLGLSICQRIIKGLGGYIEVQNNTGQGATFSVYIPTSGLPTSDGQLPPD